MKATVSSRAPQTMKEVESSPCPGFVPHSKSLQAPWFGFKTTELLVVKSSSLSNQGHEWAAGGDHIQIIAKPGFFLWKQELEPVKRGKRGLRKQARLKQWLVRHL